MTANNVDRGCRSYEYRCFEYRIPEHLLYLMFLNSMNKKNKLGWLGLGFCGNALFNFSISQFFNFSISQFSNSLNCFKRLNVYILMRCHCYAMLACEFANCMNWVECARLQMTFARSADHNQKQH